MIVLFVLKLPKHVPSSAQARKQALMSEKETIYWLECVDSTQLELKRKLQENPDMAHLSAVVADSQDNGRGRGVSKWHDVKGNSVLLSVLIRWPEPVQESFDVNRWVCCRLSRALPSKVEFKWPNDMMVGNRKLGGMLIENHWGSQGIKSSILGLGINVRASSEDIDRSIAIEALGVKGTVRQWIEEILAVLHPTATEFSDIPDLRKRYEQLLWGRSIWKNYSAHGDPFEAQVAHVQPSGLLTLKLRNGDLVDYDIDQVRWMNPY